MKLFKSTNDRNKFDNNRFTISSDEDAVRQKSLNDSNTKYSVYGVYIDKDNFKNYKLNEIPDEFIKVDNKNHDDLIL